MVPRAGILLIALVLVLGPAESLQVAAWAGMLFGRIPDRGAELALRSTFDGSDPCPLCRRAEALREQADAGDRAVTRDGHPVAVAVLLVSEPCLPPALVQPLWLPSAPRAPLAGSRAPPRPVPRRG